MKRVTLAAFLRIIINTVYLIAWLNSTGATSSAETASTSGGPDFAPGYSELAFYRASFFDIRYLTIGTRNTEIKDNNYTSKLHYKHTFV